MAGARCGHPNDAGHVYCNQCGQRMAERAALVARDYTPPHVAAKIRQSKAVVEGERKQVTALFADVKGSMELAEQLDPEEWHGVMDRFFAILTDGVHRFDGTVNQYTGDGIMALFGAPIAHEDHAQRTCWSALHLRDELRRYGDELRLGRGLNFSVRIGINSGEVIVGRIGDDLRMDYTAQGHTVGLAQRMEQLAEAGHAYLTEHTAKLVAGYFQLRDLGRLAVRGASEPLGVFDLETAGTLATRLAAARARGFTRFVGRAEEITRLEMLLEQAVAGDAQIVGVVGEPGVGKSRLCLELVQRCRARGIPVHEAHCVSHGRALPFLPVLQLFRSCFGIDERDDAATARRKIAGTLVLLDDRFREVLPLVFDFLAVPDPERPLPRMDPDARQRQLVDFVSELGRARSAREPAVILVDDLHWIDPASDALLARVLEGVGGTRTLVLVNHRPEYRAEWMQAAGYQQIELPPLGRDATDELLTGLLGDDPQLGPARARIGERAGGNPFFVEEPVRSLVDGGQLAGAPGAYRWLGGSADPTIPATVQGVIAARIDRLPEAAKSLLQTAAVIGRGFSEAVLRRVVDEPIDGGLADALATLTRAELVFARALYPEALYTFAHPLTHEVAYRSQLTERRRRVHARVAESLARLEPSTLTERSALLAHHWERAGDALQALRWHARAGDWLGAREPMEAMRHWQAVRRLVRDVPETTETLDLGTSACLWTLNLEWRVGLSEKEIAQTFSEGTAMAERRGDLAARVRLLETHGLAISMVAARYREGLALTEEALALAERAGDRAHRVVLYQRLSYFHSVMGNADDLRRVSERGMALAGGDVTLGADWVGFSPYLILMACHAISSMFGGRLAEARATVEQAEALALKHGDQEVAALACVFGATVLARSGDGPGAVSWATHALHLGERNASPIFRANALSVLGEALVGVGAWADAIAVASEALGIVRQRSRMIYLELAMLASLARAQLGAGDERAARALAIEALDLAERFPDPRYSAILATSAAAHVLLRTDGTSPDALRALAQAESIATAIPYRPFEASLRLERAEVARLRGDETGRRRWFEEAEQRFRAMDARPHADALVSSLGAVGKLGSPPLDPITVVP
jgi:class 3 adenylate cyclase/tetratricopeptide (TPR) repeat protein